MATRCLANSAAIGPYARLAHDTMRRAATALLLAACVLACGPGCQRDSAPTTTGSRGAESGTVNPPHGYSPRLLITRGGQLYRFGPFVGYYFRPVPGTELADVEFICFNEEGFYTSDLPAGAKLFTGQAKLRRLPDEGTIPEQGGRIRPVFFDEAPEAWLDTRPEPRDEYLHFHSAHNAAGATRLGYWLRHEALAEFTYDMGGRVGPESPLHHDVEPGLDTGFARIVEFDFGPSGR